MTKRLPCRLGNGNRRLSLPHVPGAGADDTARRRTVLVETGGVDMGQGAWTALAQIAAEALGLEPHQIEFRSGISTLPDAGVAGGSGHTASAGLALNNAGLDALAKLAEIATKDAASPLFGAGNIGVVPRNGRLVRRDDESRGESFADILTRSGQREVVGEAKSMREPALRKVTPCSRMVPCLPK